MVAVGMGVEHDFRSAPLWEHFVAASGEVNENLAVDEHAGEAANFTKFVRARLPVYRARAKKAEGKRGERLARRSLGEGGGTGNWERGYGSSRSQFRKNT